MTDSQALTAPNKAGELLALVSLIKAIASPIRLQILEVLQQKPNGLCVNDMAEAIGQTQSLTSHHLCFMFRSGILSRKRREQRIEYLLEFKDLPKMLDCLTKHLQDLPSLAKRKHLR